LALSFSALRYRDLHLPRHFEGAPLKKQVSLTGTISDSMCGAKHMMSGVDAGCVRTCVKNGSQYVWRKDLGDELDDAFRARPVNLANCRERVIEGDQEEERE
jgi:hypothetical protein